MSAHVCCAVVSKRSNRMRAADSGGPRRGLQSFFRHSMDFGGWIFPGAILVLLPKCPACLAAYIALGTGVGLSLPTATWLRTALIVLCVASLAYTAVRRVAVGP